MRQGETALAERCRYLVHPPDQPIPHRDKQDPRAIRALDPACGSAHFLLYGFDLFEVMYIEAYDDPDLGPTLQRDYPTRAEFQRAVPDLILRHNLHGIDIDLRARQIAALALWLRANRSWQQMGLKMRERPLVERVNIVCAEPMPGEADLLDEFLGTLNNPVVRDLVRGLWHTMQWAGEAGSLLKIEQVLREEIAQAKIEHQVLEELRRFAASTANGQTYTRRLFAQDAEQGFALIDLLREPFDVVWMNPPFGAASKNSKAYIEEHYPLTKNDLYAAFVERGLELLRPRGLLGAITSRTGFFLTSFRQWREDILIPKTRIHAVADLGYGVLDTAMVEMAAYVLEKQ